MSQCHHGWTKKEDAAFVVKARLTARAAVRDVEHYHDMVVRLSQAVAADSVITHGVGTVAGAVTDAIDALHRATQAVIDAKTAAGSPLSGNAYRSTLDSLHCGVRFGVEIRRAADSLIARVLTADIHIAHDRATRPVRSARRTPFLPGLLALIDAADTFLPALAAARTLLDVSDGTGRTRRGLPARAQAAAAAATAHALRAERIGASFSTPCPEGPAFTRAQAQLARAVAERVPVLTSTSLSETTPHRVAIEQRKQHKDRAYHATILAEAYEQVSRTCVAVVGVRGVAERIRRTQGVCVMDVREQAVCVADTAICLCASIEAGRTDLVDEIRQQADAAERIEDTLVAMLRSPSGHGVQDNATLAYRVGPLRRAK